MVAAAVARPTVGSAAGRHQAPRSAPQPCQQTARSSRHRATQHRSRQLQVVAAAAAAAAPPAAAGNGSAAASVAPSAAETARTIVDLVAHGTLCTLSPDGVPLGTYVSYVLDAAGQPILRLRADAVHTANLQRDPQCSLFVQPGEHSARLLARVTLIGAVEPVSAGRWCGVVVGPREIGKSSCVGCSRLQ